VLCQVPRRICVAIERTQVLTTCGTWNT
jgi:hypothetical protein